MQYKAMRARRNAGAKSVREPKGGNMRNKRIRYAVVGLGHIAQAAVLPAFKHAENSELAALITGNPEKDRELSERYGAPAYKYDDLEKAIHNEKVDAVYIATPN